MEATVLGEDRSGPFVVSDLWVPVDDVLARLAPPVHPAQRGADARQRRLRRVYFGGIRMPPSTRMVSAFM